MKTKPRFKQLQKQEPIKGDLSQFSDDELFTELIKRATLYHPTSCYFVDRSTIGKWSMHTAHEDIIAKIIE